MENHSLFTLDFKAQNMGRRPNGQLVYIDFSPENSLKLKDGISDDIKRKYVSLSILIFLLVLLSCNDKITPEQINELSNRYVNLTLNEFMGFRPVRAYFITFDRNIDYEFITSVAPNTFLDSPEKLLTHYYKGRDLNTFMQGLLDEKVLDVTLLDRPDGLVKQMNGNL